MSTFDPFSQTFRLAEESPVLHARTAVDYVAAAFATLPDNWRQALWYCEMQGLTPSDAAPLLGVGPEQVSSLLQGARTGLHQTFAAILLQEANAGFARKRVRPGLTV